MGVQRAAPNAALLLAVAPSVSNLHSQKPFTYLPPALFLSILVTGVPRCCLMWSCAMHMTGCDLLTHRISLCALNYLCVCYCEGRTCI